jgi:hypothetical protein
MYTLGDALDRLERFVDMNNILTINSNSNLYKPTDPFFDIANNFINKQTIGLLH